LYTFVTESQFASHPKFTVNLLTASDIEPDAKIHLDFIFQHINTGQNLGLGGGGECVVVLTKGIFLRGHLV
jgi:hypothetical protein